MTSFHTVVLSLKISQVSTYLHVKLGWAQRLQLVTDEVCMDTGFFIQWLFYGDALEEVCCSSVTLLE